MVNLMGFPLTARLIDVSRDDVERDSIPALSSSLSLRRLGHCSPSQGRGNAISSANTGLREPHALLKLGQRGTRTLFQSNPYFHIQWPLFLVQWDPPQEKMYHPIMNFIIHFGMVINNNYKKFRRNCSKLFFTLVLKETYCASFYMTENCFLLTGRPRVSALT